MSLRDELAALPPAIADAFSARGLGVDWLIERAATLGRTNRVDGVCAAPPSIPMLPTSPALQARGEALLAAGQVAFCVLAGGMATRMGSVCKALVEIAPEFSFLDARLAEQRALATRYGHAPPLWLMVSDATEAPIRTALAAADGAAEHTALFSQNVSLRLDPRATTPSLFRMTNGEPSLHATGHGDLIDGLFRSGLLQRFVDAGGKYLLVANLDNLGATLDPSALGWFSSVDAPLAVELVDKVGGDRGGIPVSRQGRVEILEEFRLPEGFDATTVPSFNTNTFWIDAPQLLATRVEWSWFQVEKKVEDRPAIQFERLLGELTSALPAEYVRVPRDGEASRFLPVKDHQELASRRDTILRALAQRGIR